MKKRILLITAALMMLMSIVGCGDTDKSSVNKDNNAASGELFASGHQEVESPQWAVQLDAFKDAEQVIVVAGIDKNTAYISMHEKKDGKWKMILTTPGFIGLDGLGKANINDALTPVGTFTIDKAFGIADDPGCQMEYTKVDDTYYWSGDVNNHFNELVSTRDVPGLDTENSEHITDYQYEYQYALNMGFNSECAEENGYAFFFHCFGDRKPYTGGCVSVPENIMKIIMQNVRPGCKITIDTIKNFNANITD